MRGMTPSSAHAVRRRRHAARGGGVVDLPCRARIGTLLRRGGGASRRRSARQPRWRAGLGSRMSLRPRSSRASPQGCARPRRARRARARARAAHDAPCLRL